MTTYRVGDIVSVNFPFADLQMQKRRPGLVLMSDDIDLVVARVTTHPPRHQSDVALNRWAESGLPHASTVRLTKLATLDHRLVHRAVGHLHSEDIQSVIKAWEQLTATIVTGLSR